MIFQEETGKLRRRIYACGKHPRNHMNYTDRQKEAINCIDQNLQIIACAGSGKTQVISARIVNILKAKQKGGISAANIVAFTFTDKAAGELKDRIHRLCKEELG